MSVSPQDGENATSIRAIFLVVGACLLFSFLDSSAKYLVVHGMASPFVAWVRFVGHLVVVFVLLRGWSRPAELRYRSLPMQFLRGLLLFATTILNFTALKTLPLADALAIMFFSPMLMTALAGPMLGEWAGPRRWAAVGVGFIGILVVTRPGSGLIGPGHLLAMAAMVCNSLYGIMTRKLGATETAGSLIFYSALVPAILLAPAAPLAGSLPPSPIAWVVMILLGVWGAASHWLLIRAYQLAPVGALAPYTYTQLIWVTIIGYLVFGDIPDFYTVVGAMIIVASGLYIVNRERQLRKASISVPVGEEAELAKKL